MSIRQTQWGWGLMVLGTVAFAGAMYATGDSETEPVATANPTAGVEAILPAEPVVVVSYRGLDDTEEAWKETAAYQSIHESGLAEVFSDLFSSLVRQGGTDARVAGDLLNAIEENGFSAAIWLGESGGAFPSGHAVLIAEDAGSLEPRVADLLKRTLELNFRTEDQGGRTVTSALIPDSPGLELGWWVEGDDLVVTFGQDTVMATLDIVNGKSPNISTNKRWVKLNTPADGVTLSSVAWLDLGEVRRRTSEIPIPMGGPRGYDGSFEKDYELKEEAFRNEEAFPNRPEAIKPGEAIEEKFEGIEEPRAIEQDVPADIVEDVGDVEAEVQVEARFTRRAAVQEEIEFTVGDILKIIGLDKIGPVSVTTGYQGKATVVTSHLELPAPRTGLMTVLDQKPMTIEDLPPIPKETAGFSVSRFDLADYYRSMIGMAREFTKKLPEDDRAEFEEMLRRMPREIGFEPEDFFEAAGDIVAVYADDKQGLLGFAFVMSVDDEDEFLSVIEHLQDMASEETRPDEFDVERTRKHGGVITTLRIGNGIFNPSYTVYDGWFVLGLVPQVPEAFILRSQGKLPTWEPTGEVVTALEELPKEFTSLSVVDTARTYQTIMAYAPFVAGALEAGLRQGFGEEVNIPFKVADLPPAEVVSAPLFPNVSMTTVDATGVTSISRMAIAPIPGNVLLTAPIAAGLLVPAVESAQKAAYRSQSMNNMKQIGLAMHNYHDVYGHMPTGTYIDPNARNKALPVQDRLGFLASILPFIEQSYLYEELDFSKPWHSDINEYAASERLDVFTNPRITKSGGLLRQFGLGVGGMEDRGERAWSQDKAKSYDLVDEPVEAVEEATDEFDPGEKIEESFEDDGEAEVDEQAAREVRVPYWAAKTHYVGIAGVGADAPTLPVGHKRAGMFGYNRKVSFRDVTDGLSNTAMIVEASGNDAPPWASGKLSIRGFAQKPYLGGPDNIGFGGDEPTVFLMGDGSVRTIPSTIDPSVIEAMSTISGGELVEIP